VKPWWILGPALLGCRPDPVLDAWHGVVEITEARRAEACDDPLVDFVPSQPWLFVAVARGLPDSASLYWCDGPETCGPSFANVLLRTLDTDRLAGDVGSATLGSGLCLVHWEDIEATRDGDTVELLFRTGTQSLTEDDEALCLAQAEAAVGGTCDAVLSLRGTRVE
jgi:hypothetical protein